MFWLLVHVLPILKARKLDVVKQFSNKFKTVWFIVLTTNGHSRKMDVLNRKICRFDTDQYGIAIPLCKYKSIFC